MKHFLLFISVVFVFVFFLHTKDIYFFLSIIFLFSFVYSDMKDSDRKENIRIQQMNEMWLRRDYEKMKKWRRKTWQE